MSKNTLETEWLEITSQYGVYALHAGKARLHARTLEHVHAPGYPHARTRLNVMLCYVMLYVRCLSCLSIPNFPHAPYASGFVFGVSWLRFYKI